MSNKIRFLLICLFSFIPSDVVIRDPIYPDECMACIFQRDGKLPYILRRYIDEASGPDPNQTFGHCFVCIQCPGNLMPSCFGWWPSEPSGADYDGDQGHLRVDNKEKWGHGSCQSISVSKASTSIDYLLNYEANNDYQVINKGGRSCLGFCEDISNELEFKNSLPMGDLTIPGDMSFPHAALQFDQPNSKPTAEEVMFYLVELHTWQGQPKPILSEDEIK